MKKTILLLFILLNAKGFAQQKPQAVTEPPAWAKSVVWYEMFVERFHNGDPSNDPTIADITVPGQSEPPADWAITPWTSDWYQQEPWALKMGKPLAETVFFRRYGGDLQGVLKKLDYLQDLGITAIYFRPLNYAPSLHKYDARSYHHIDVNFGPDPEGDKKIIATENPLDPSTWKWTAADKMFLNVIEEAHKRNIRVVLDYSWNHTGILFWAFEDILKNQEKAATKDWYVIEKFDDPATPQNEFAFKGWLDVQSLPELTKVDVTTKRIIGRPYEGDLHPAVKKHVYDVTKRWLMPDGDLKKGVDGYRLDVADHIGMKFWRDYRTYVKSINPEAYLVGEIWWEKWPEQLMNPVPYTSGDVFDAVMFYQIYRPARYFFAKTNFDINAKQFRDSLEFQWGRLSESTKYAMMNTSSSADAPRLLSDFYNPNKYKYNLKPVDDPNFRSGKPDAESYQRLKLYIAHAFTNIGAPSIYAGEEMGMWGGDDPEDRKPLWWKEFTFDNETRTNIKPGKKEYDPVGFNEDLFSFYRKMASIRHANPVLSTGKIEFLTTEGKKLAYRRYDNKDEVLVLFNVTHKKQKFSVPKGKYTELINQKGITGESVEVAPFTAMVLRK